MLQSSLLEKAGVLPELDALTGRVKLRQRDGAPLEPFREREPGDQGDDDDDDEAPSTATGDAEPQQL